MRNTIITVMLGMNRFTQRDTRHPFSMGHMRGYNDMWLQSVDRDERTHSTPFYEISKAVDEVRQEFTEIKDNIAFIFGRGHIGNAAEEDLCDTWLNAMRNYKDAIHIMYAKSYGAIDLLRALKFLRETHHQEPNIDLMFLVDGYGISRAKRSVTDNNDRFIIPGNVKKAYGIVQREKGFKGFRAGKIGDSRCSNHVVSKSEVAGKIYDHYRDGYKRRLEVCHKHMEEIAAVIPCCEAEGQMLTTNDVVKETLRRLWS